MTRYAAARGRADSCQPECIRAIKLLGLPHRVLSMAGGGVGDILVLMPMTIVGVKATNYTLPFKMEYERPPYFLEMECKVPSRKDGGVKASKFTKAQKEWREQTPNAPRITVTGFEDTLRQLRYLMGT